MKIDCPICKTSSSREAGAVAFIQRRRRNRYISYKVRAIFARIILSCDECVTRVDDIISAWRACVCMCKRVFLCATAGGRDAAIQTIVIISASSSKFAAAILCTHDSARTASSSDLCPFTSCGRTADDEGVADVGLRPPDDNTYSVYLLCVSVLHIC